MAGFTTNYNVGGTVDQVNGLPYPTFPTMYVPYTVGRQVTLSGSQATATDTFSFPYDVQYINIAVAAEQYNATDYWSLNIGGTPLCDSIYMKGVPETISAGGDSRVVYPIVEGTLVTFTYTNNSLLPNTIAYNVKVLTASGGGGVVNG